MILTIYNKDIEVIGRSKLAGLKIFYSPLLRVYVKYSLTERESDFDDFIVKKFYFGDIWDLKEFIQYIRQNFGYKIDGEFPKSLYYAKHWHLKERK
jgi:hypothetical protein